MSEHRVRRAPELSSTADRRRPGTNGLVRVGPNRWFDDPADERRAGHLCDRRTEVGP